MKLFKHIQIETNSFCTRKCIFCPKYKDERKEIVELPMETIYKIVDELKELDFNNSSRIDLSVYNEPTFDKRLPEIIKYIRENLPKVNIFFNSNGDVYKKPEQYIKLFENGLSGLELNIYDESRREFLTNIRNETIKLYGEDKLEKHRRTHIVENDNIYYKAANGHFKFVLVDKINFVELKSIHKIRNRAGNIPWLVKDIKNSLNKICSFPFKNFVIRASGDVALCCDDYYNEGLLGNVNENTLIEIWYGEKSTEYRKNLYNKNRNIYPCNKCDNGASKHVEHTYKQWKELVEEKEQPIRKSLFED